MDKLKEAVSEVTNAIEKQVDEEIDKLENLNITDFEALREQRLNAMKKQTEEKRKWLSLGHGTYSELAEEKNFFEVTKNSNRVVCHFYRDGAMRCKILDMHLKTLAEKHIETRFVSLNAPKCPFLAEKLKIVIIPTILVIRDRKCIDRIEGFTDLGNRDDFDVSMLEWRLARGNAINYDGDLYEPPLTHTKQKLTVGKKKTITSSLDDHDVSD